MQQAGRRARRPERAAVSLERRLAAAAPALRTSAAVRRERREHAAVQDEPGLAPDAVRDPEADELAVVRAPDARGTAKLPVDALRRVRVVGAGRAADAGAEDVHGAAVVVELRVAAGAYDQRIVVGRALYGAGVQVHDRRSTRGVAEVEVCVGRRRLDGAAVDVHCRVDVFAGNGVLVFAAEGKRLARDYRRAVGKHDADRA